VFAGWGTEFSKVYLGAELGYYLNTSKKTKTFPNAGVPIEAEAKIKGRLEVAARIGYNAGGMLPYAKLGYGWIQQTLTDKTANTTIFDKRMSGLVLGAGLDYKVSQKLLAGLGYTYADMKKNFMDSLGVAQKTTLTNHSVLLRVGYHF
jgi:opacity protein-like surface antigen